jgi:hypothetical protein
MELAGRRELAVMARRVSSGKRAPCSRVSKPRKADTVNSEPDDLLADGAGVNATVQETRQKIVPAGG